MIFRLLHVTAINRLSTAMMFEQMQQSEQAEHTFDQKIRDLMSKKTVAFVAYRTRFVLRANQTRLEQMNRLDIMLRNELESANTMPVRYDNIKKHLYEFIAQIESDNDTSYLLVLLNRSGVYRSLYHNPRMFGTQDNVLQEMVNTGFYRAMAATIFVVVFAVIGSLGLPTLVIAFANAFFAASVTYLNGVFSALCDQFYASRSSLPNLILGHTRTRTSVMKNNTRWPQAIAWTMIESTDRSFSAGLIFMLTAFILSLFSPVYMWALPVMFLLTPCVSKIIDIFSVRNHENPDDHLMPLLNSYQKKGIQLMCLSNEEKNAWLANVVRQRYVKRAFVLSTTVGLTCFICANMFSGSFPVVFGTLLFNMVLPFTFILPTIALVVFCGVYLYRAKNTQVDNRFKLSFEPDKVMAPDAVIKDEAETMLSFSNLFVTVDESHPNRVNQLVEEGEVTYTAPRILS